MHLNDLFAGQFDRYFAEAHAGKPLWLFVHVPKTAGSSLNAELNAVLSPAAHIFINYAELNATEAAQTYETLFDQAVDKFIQKARGKKFRFCTGHINASHVLRIRDSLPDVRPMTLLREPVSRYISDYRYQKSDMHPGHEQFAAAYPTIHDYLKLEGDFNKTATSLLPPELWQARDVEACVAWLTETYAFIGVQELYSLSLHALTWFGGVPRRPQVRKRINTPTPDNDVVLTLDLQEEIREKNSLDIAIYDALAPRFTAIADRMQAYLDRVAPRPPRD